ncbi:MAG: hypothetical protein R3F19_08460 [Verrucomicrobiales bacterium]
MARGKRGWQLMMLERNWPWPNNWQKNNNGTRQSRSSTGFAAAPKDKTAEMRRVRLAKANAQMLAHQLPDAHQDLGVLVEEMTEDQSADPQVLQEARSAHANSQYYLTWLMRLEGVGKETWGPEIEAARQTYRLLAEDAVKSGDAAFGKKVSEDLESTIRLARMDLGELQGLPLPNQ